LNDPKGISLFLKFFTKKLLLFENISKSANCMTQPWGYSASNVCQAFIASFEYFYIISLNFFLERTKYLGTSMTFAVTERFELMSIRHFSQIVAPLVNYERMV